MMAVYHRSVHSPTPLRRRRGAAFRRGPAAWRAVQDTPGASQRGGEEAEASDYGGSSFIASGEASIWVKWWLSFHTSAPLPALLLSAHC